MTEGEYWPHYIMYIFPFQLTFKKTNNWYPSYTKKIWLIFQQKKFIFVEIDGYLPYIAPIYLQYQFPPQFLLHTKVSTKHFCSFLCGVICQMLVSNKIQSNKYVGDSYKFIQIK